MIFKLYNKDEVKTLCEIAKSSGLIIKEIIEKKQTYLEYNYETTELKPYDGGYIIEVEVLE